MKPHQIGAGLLALAAFALPCSAQQTAFGLPHQTAGAALFTQGEGDEWLFSQLGTQDDYGIIILTCPWVTITETLSNPDTYTSGEFLEMVSIGDMNGIDDTTLATGRLIVEDLGGPMRGIGPDNGFNVEVEYPIDLAIDTVRVEARFQGELRVSAEFQGGGGTIFNDLAMIDPDPMTDPTITVDLDWWWYLKERRNEVWSIIRFEGGVDVEVDGTSVVADEIIIAGINPQGTFDGSVSFLEIRTQADETTPVFTSVTIVDEVLGQNGLGHRAMGNATFVGSSSDVIVQNIGPGLDGPSDGVAVDLDGAITQGGAEGYFAALTPVDIAAGDAMRLEAWGTSFSTPVVPLGRIDLVGNIPGIIDFSLDLGSLEATILLVQASDGLGSSTILGETTLMGDSTGTITSSMSGTLNLVGCGFLPTDPAGMVLEFDDDVTFTPNSGAATVTGSELRFLAVDAPFPVGILTGFNILAETSLEAISGFTIIGETVNPRHFGFSDFFGLPHTSVGDSVLMDDGSGRLEIMNPEVSPEVGVVFVLDCDRVTLVNALRCPENIPGAISVNTTLFGSHNGESGIELVRGTIEETGMIGAEAAYSVGVEFLAEAGSMVRVEAVSDGAGSVSSGFFGPGSEPFFAKFTKTAGSLATDILMQETWWSWDEDNGEVLAILRSDEPLLMQIGENMPVEANTLIMALEGTSGVYGRSINKARMTITEVNDMMDPPDLSLFGIVDESVGMDGVDHRVVRDALLEGGSRSIGVLNIGDGGCPCDLNDDASIDIQDLLVLLSSWFTLDPAADINDDGLVDIQDLLLFLSCWFPSSAVDDCSLAPELDGVSLEFGGILGASGATDVEITITPIDVSVSATGEFVAQATGTYQGTPGSSLGEVRLQEPLGLVSLGADFSAVGAFSVFVTVIDGGVPSGGPDLVSSGALGITLEPLSMGDPQPALTSIVFLSSPAPAYLLRFDRRGTFTLPSAGPVTGDEILLAADPLAAFPAQMIEFLDLLAAGTGPFYITGEQTVP